MKLKQIISRKDCQVLSFLFRFLKSKKRKPPLKNIGKNYIMLRYGLALSFLFEQAVKN
jgi:hypothetical protein